jgi:hypothetical protein
MDKYENFKRVIFLSDLPEVLEGQFDSGIASEG